MAEHSVAVDNRVYFDNGTFLDATEEQVSLLFRLGLIRTGPGGKLSQRVLLRGADIRNVVQGIVNTFES